MAVGEAPDAQPYHAPEGAMSRMQTKAEIIDAAIASYNKDRDGGDDERDPTPEYSTYLEESPSRGIVDLGDEDGSIGVSYIVRIGLDGFVTLSEQRRPV